MPQDTEPADNKQEALKSLAESAMTRETEPEEDIGRINYVPITAVQRFDMEKKFIRNGVYLGPISIEFEGSLRWLEDQRRLEFDFEEPCATGFHCPFGQAVKPPPGISREYIVSLTVTSLLPATAITIINVLLMLVARWFGEREVHLTKTGEAAAITWYMTVAMVINGAVELNLELDKYRGKEDPTDRDMFRYVEEKVRSWEVCFEPTIMDLPRKSSYPFHRRWQLIYMPLLPLAPLVGLVSILFQYINDKWMLLRYCRRPSIVQNAEAALEGMMRMRYVLPWLLPIMMIIFLRPCYGQQGPINIAVAGSLLPGIAFMLVPTRHLAVCFRWAMPSWLQSESHRRGSVVDETTQDYYQAQHLWPKAVLQLCECK
eukprot:g3372.t1